MRTSVVLAAASIFSATQILGQEITSLTPQESHKVAVAVSPYIESERAALTSVGMIIATALPTALQKSLEHELLTPGSQTATGPVTALPSYFSYLPPDVQSFILSFDSEVLSIAYSTLGLHEPTGLLPPATDISVGAAPTAAPVLGRAGAVVGAVAAAAVVGAGML